MATAVLYSPEVLALATSLARYPHDPAQPLRGEARSRTCGSAVTVSLALDETGDVAALGLKVHACAIGQAAAAIFAQAAIGLDRTAIAAAQLKIEAWLEGGPAPTWPGIEAIAAARAYPARHGAMLLPWKAALAALPTSHIPG